MELGEKLRRARLEAGMTQKQLCENVVTRNMLSQIENGTAQPSMKTLGLLAGRLGKNISYFLEESAVLSPNRQVMERSRACFDSRDYNGARKALEAYQTPDPVYDRERRLLENLCLLQEAERAIREERKPYARELLDKTKTDGGYCAEELQRRKEKLLRRMASSFPAADLPEPDEELLLRAETAFKEGNPKRAAELLIACQIREEPVWQLLRGKICLEERQYQAARVCLQNAENTFPEETAPLLEQCCRELGDYRAAYEYACRQKKER